METSWVHSRLERRMAPRFISAYRFFMACKVSCLIFKITEYRVKDRAVPFGLGGFFGWKMTVLSKLKLFLCKGQF